MIHYSLCLVFLWFFVCLSFSCHVRRSSTFEPWVKMFALALGLVILLPHAFVCRLYEDLDGQNHAYYGFTTLIMTTVIVVKAISNIFSLCLVFGIFCLPARKNTVLQPTNLEELRDSKPSKLSQKIGFMALEERHDARMVLLSSNSISLNKVVFVSGGTVVFCMHCSFIFSVACSEITRVALID